MGSEARDRKNMISKRKVTKKVWELIFPLRVGNRIKVIRLHPPLPHDLKFLHERGTITAISFSFASFLSPRLKVVNFQVQLDNFEGLRLGFFRDELRRIDEDEV